MIVQLHNSPHSVLIDDDDFSLISEFTWYHNPEGYALTRKTIGGKRTSIWMHRLIMDAQAGEKIDHIDGDGLNNQRANLRFASAAENMYNRRKNKDASSKYKGVTLVRKTNHWIAGLNYEGKRVYIGYFAIEEDAARAYDQKARELFGEFARTNF